MEFMMCDNDVSDDEGNLLMLSGSDGSTIWSKNYDTCVGIDNLYDDANGDGIYDVIVSWCKYDVSNKAIFGVDLLNGDDGTKIWSKLSSYDGEFDCIGIDADEFSDINGDGIMDVLVCQCREEDHEEKTYLTIKTFNGVNGAEFWEKTVLYKGEWWWNWAHEAGGDMNGDGIEDVLLESEGWDAENDRGISEIQAFNGKTGLELWKKNFTGYPTRGHYACGDLNGDGLNDIVVNIKDWENNKCGVWAIRGYDGLVIWEKHFYGWCYARWYDFNGDGLNDVLIENVDRGNKSAKILVAKGTDGTPLWEKYYDNVSDMDFTILDDINGDAISDVCIALKTGSTEMQMLSGRIGSLIWTKTFAEDIGRINYCEDLDGDDKEDIVFLNTTEIGQTIYVYKLTALSGVNGNVLWKNSFTHVVDMEFPEYAWTDSWSWAYGWIDLNGDGLTDILLEIEWHCGYWDENASTHREYSDNKLVLMDGKDGSEIWDVEYTLDEYGYWGCIDTWVDFNNDGIKDVLLGTRKGVYLLTISEAANIPPTATIDSITPDPAIQGKDIVHFRGHGSDSDGSVVAYEWTSDKDGVLSNEEDFDMPASDLSVGTHIISFKVKDDDGVWSTADTEDLTIKPAEEFITIGELIEKLSEDPEGVINKKFSTSGWVYFSTHEAWKGIEVLNDVLMTIEIKVIDPLPLPESIKQLLKELLKYLSPANVWNYCFGIHSMGIMSISESDQRYNYFPLLHAYAKNDNLWPEPGSVVYIEGTWEKRTILWKTIGYIFRVDKVVVDKTYVTPSDLKELDVGTNVKMMALIAKKHIQPDNTYKAFYGKDFEIYLKLPEGTNLQNLTFVEIQGKLTSKTSTNTDSKKVLKCTVTVDNLKVILASKAYLESQIKNKETIIIDCPINATITDQYGRIIADNGTNEIPNASMLIINETKIFYLPADLTYSVDIDAYDTGTFNFTRISPVGNDISITKFENISVTESTKASVEIVPNVTNYTMSIDYNGDGEIDEEKSPDVSETIVIIENIFDTVAPENPYPSISGTFNGTITPYKTIIVKNLYTYPCEGTGGHTEYVRIYNESGTIAEAEWKGYKGDWHNITFPKNFTLEGGKTYNITIVALIRKFIIHPHLKQKMDL